MFPHSSGAANLTPTGISLKLPPDNIVIYWVKVTTEQDRERVSEVGPPYATTKYSY